MAAWVALRVVAPPLLLLAAPELATGWLTRVPYAHGLAKGILGPWATMLYRQSLLPGLLVGAVVAALVLPGLPPRRWVSGAGVVLVAAVLWPLDPAWGPFVGFLALLLLNLAPRDRLAARTPRWWPALPGTELLTFGPVAAALGLGPVAHRVLVALGAVGLSLGWFAVDAVVTGHARKPDINYWYESRTDPRVRVLERAAPGIDCEYHDVDVVGDRVIVVAEGSHRLLSWPRTLEGPPATVALPPMWGQLFGVTMDAETDPVTGTTWFLNGALHVGAVDRVGAGFGPIRNSVRLPIQLDHVYTRHFPAEGLLRMVTVNARPMPGLSTLVSITVPDLQTVDVVRLRTPDGEPLDAIRDFEWLPTLGKLALAPDFGDRLFLADPHTGIAEPWITMPTMNGKLHWVDEVGRLFAALPNRAEVWVIDVERGVVDRTIPTQIGVRPVEVDPERKLLITASVATGAVWVQDLETGRRVDRFRTVMPIVRELGLLREEGMAVLSTWTVLYAVPYAAR